MTIIHKPQSFPVSGGQSCLPERAKDGSTALAIRTASDGGDVLERVHPPKIGPPIPLERQPSIRALKQAYRRVWLLNKWMAFKSWFSPINPQKEAKTLSRLLWSQFLAQWVQNPDQAKTTITAYLQSPQHQQLHPVLREGSTVALTYLLEHLDDPNTLQEVCDLTAQILVNGGAKKLEKLLNVVQQPSFSGKPPAEQGKLILEAMGLSAIKLAQTLGSIPGVVPPSVKPSLEGVYENLTPMPFETVKTILETSLQQPLERLFASFNPIPLKTASMGQVHEAKLPSGERVAVKVLKSGTRELVDEDAAMLKPVITLLERFFPHIDTKTVLEGFIEMLHQECDMEAEAQRLKDLGIMLNNIPNAKVPRVIDSHTAPQVLTMEFVEGYNLKNFQGNQQVAEGYLELLLTQLLVDGACQADPLSSNIAYQPKTGKYCIYDAGQVYFIPDLAERMRFVKLLTGLYAQDVGTIADALLETSDKGLLSQKSYQAFKGALQKALPTRQAMMEGEVPGFIALATLEAMKLNLPIAHVHPLIWKTFFTGVGVTLTVSPEARVGRIVGEHFLKYLLKQDPRFALSLGWKKFQEEANAWLKG